MGIIDHGVAIGTELHLPILHGMQEHPAYYQAQRKVHQLWIQTASFKTTYRLAHPHTNSTESWTKQNDNCNIR